jgi:hypothetical protein
MFAQSICAPPMRMTDYASGFHRPRKLELAL